MNTNIYIMTKRITNDKHGNYGLNMSLRCSFISVRSNFQEQIKERNLKGKFKGKIFEKKFEARTVFTDAMLKKIKTFKFDFIIENIKKINIFERKIFETKREKLEYPLIRLIIKILYIHLFPIYIYVFLQRCFNSKA